MPLSCAYKIVEPAVAPLIVGKFGILVVENSEPYNCAVYKLSEELLHNAELKINNSLELYKAYLNGEIYSKGYHEDIMELS